MLDGERVPMSAFFEALYLDEATLRAMIAHAEAAAPEECVGLLFGREARVTRCAPLPNVADDKRHRFLAEPEGLLRALQEADARGEALLAIYHSHPSGRQEPSPRDLSEARYQAAQLIVVPQRGVVRAFRLEGTHYREIALIVERTS